MKRPRPTRVGLSPARFGRPHFPNGGIVPVAKKELPVLKMDDVFRVAELAALAEDWASHGSDFPTNLLDRYRELCADYGIDAALLLYVVQTKLTNEAALDATATLPTIGDLQKHASGN